MKNENCQQIIFSVIIPTYHRNDLLAKCLDRLAPGVQTLSADQYEVIVSDDGRETTAEEMIEQHYPWAKWVVGPKRGPAANRNNGAKYAQGEWLVFTDDDCLPDVQWLEAYTEAITAHPNYQVFEGRTYVDRPQQSLAEKSPANETGGYLWSCNFCIQKGLFNCLNGFDERFPYAAMEDADFRLKLTKAEKQFLFVRNAAICHPWRISGGWQESQRHIQSTLIYLSIHPEQNSKINARHYLFMFFRNLFKITLPGVLRFKCAGAKIAFLELLSLLQMSFLLWTKQVGINNK